MNQADLQSPFDVAVVIQTVLRPRLLQAVRSVFAQDYPGRIQVLLGIDRREGDPTMISALQRECPERMTITVIDPGYSTSRRHGSVYPNFYGGALRTVLSYLANSRYVAYLDDDNWWARQHLSSLLAAIAGKAWAFSLRVMVDEKSDEIICRDEFFSLGPGKGIWAPQFGGLVDTGCLLLDKLACHETLPAWCLARFTNGAGEDSMVFGRLKHLPWGATDLYTSFYRTNLDSQPSYLLWCYKKAGVDLERFVAPQKMPTEDVWEACARLDQTTALQAQG